MDIASLQSNREIHPLGAYHRGQARLFLARMGDGHAAWVGPLNKIRHDAIATLRRRQGRPPRPEMLTDLERAWRRLPTNGQLCPLHVTRERHRFEVIDLRCIPERLRKNEEDWNPDETEPSLMLAAYSLSIAPDKAIMETVVLASVCIHGVGRRYERASDLSDEAVIADMVALVAFAGRNSDEPPGSFTTPLADEGQWVGKRSGFITPDGQRYPTVAHARTYLLT